MKLHCSLLLLCSFFSMHAMTNNFDTQWQAAINKADVQKMEECLKLKPSSTFVQKSIEEIKISQGKLMIQCCLESEEQCRKLGSIRTILQQYIKTRTSPVVEKKVSQEKGDNRNKEIARQKLWEQFTLLDRKALDYSEKKKKIFDQIDEINLYSK
jgi:hypothetical protein